MDDSLKGFSSSSSIPTKPSANPRISNTESKEADENDQKFSKNQNQKKPPHFMSPTISAISKKKILTERNESLDSSETHQLNTSNLVPEASPINLLNSSNRTFSQKTASHKSEDDEHNDSASKPYDPLTNYLSPRPKFLRYNPKKRRGDMLTRRETETEKEVEGSDEQSSTERSSSPKSYDEIENDDNDAAIKDDDHSLEEDDEEIQDFEEEEGGLSWRGVFKFVLVAAVLSLLTWYISCMNTSEPSPAINPIRRSTDGYINVYNRMYDTVDVNNSGQDLVQSIDVTEDGSGGESEEAENVYDQNFRVEMDGHEQPGGIEITESEEKHKPFQEEQLSTSVSDSVDTDVSENHDYHEMEAVLEDEREHEEGIEIAAAEDKSESFEEYQTLPASNLGDNYVSENEKTEGEIETSVEGEDNSEERSLIEFFGTIYSKNNLVYGVFVALFMIIASSILALYSKYKYKKAAIQKSQLTKKKAAENIRSNYPFAPNLEKDHIKKVESYARPSPYISSVEENSNDFPVTTHAPEVELLGEFVVGDVWSSMKNCSMTSKTKELQVKFSDVEFQGETSSIFQDKVVYSRPRLSTPEFSAAASTAADSPSYGSVTDKKKRVKKEEGSATTTPVRRSSRLQNRVTSP